MRDLESIRFALTIAETGHLVFASLHTNDTAQALARIIDVFPAEQQAQVRTQLSAALTGDRLPAADPARRRWPGRARYEVLVGQLGRPQPHQGRQDPPAAQRARDRPARGHGDLRAVAVGAGQRRAWSTYDDAVARSLYPKDIELLGRRLRGGCRVKLHRKRRRRADAVRQPADVGRQPRRPTGLTRIYPGGTPARRDPRRRAADPPPSRSWPRWPSRSAGPPKLLGQRLVECGPARRARPRPGGRPPALARPGRPAARSRRSRRRPSCSTRRPPASWSRSRWRSTGDDVVSRWRVPLDEPPVAALREALGRPVDVKIATALGHPAGDRQQLPGADRGRRPGRGVRGSSTTAGASGRPARADASRGQRRRAGRPGRPPDHHAGAARPRVRHPHRAAGRPGAGAVPHRRRAARRARRCRRRWGRRWSAASRSWRT